MTRDQILEALKVENSGNDGYEVSRITFDSLLELALKAIEQRDRYIFLCGTYVDETHQDIERGCDQELLATLTDKRGEG
jgi:hypothetical protein